jgi:diaminopimelate decarboxylase
MMESVNLGPSGPLTAKIKELDRSNTGPFYLYDRDRILENCRQFLEIPYLHKCVHFAMMANSTPRFVEIIQRAGLKVFVNSIIHLETALQQGFSGSEIVYAASAMDQDTMSKVASCGALVILDSIGQVEQWSALFPERGVGIRCNIGERVTPKETAAGYFIGDKSRLGLTIAEIGRLKGNPHIWGLHTYVGTNIVDVDYFLDCYRHIASLADLFPALRFLDFGGGFGLEEGSAHPFDIKTYGQRVSRLMNALSERVGRSIQLLLEPGRIIGGDAGYFCCRVVDIKSRGGQQLIGVNASCTQFPRPLFYPDSAYHPVSILPQTVSANDGRELQSSIFGCSTYSRDYLARDVLLPQAAVGDIVVLGYAGSYCASAHTSFLGFPQASEYFYEN